ncbi:reprolysin-like metallopeptidase [Chondrinema litorale]|uniref:reprolysin-like metallopeptidase n=1 Tax=Chondrinema litorale TaxID=2994555 RepID=UPI0025439DFF|nr:zinc-dependent metalloprotease family protein [Chondrinema litorale]UZR93283.1 M12 family metallo-peptidase [Chondrinema litorale]
MKLHVLIQIKCIEIRLILILLSLLVLKVSSTSAQINQDINPWTLSNTSSANLRLKVANQINAKGKNFTLNQTLFNSILSKVPKEKSTTNKSQNKVKLSFPLPNGEFVSYNVTEIDILPESLKKKYPEIKTYKGYDSTGKPIWFNKSKSGISAAIYSTEGIVYLDLAGSSQNKTYHSYYKKDYQSSEVLLEEKTIENTSISHNSAAARFSADAVSNSTFRSFRIAISATGEYTQYHGGTVEAALSEIVNIITRINAVYERELGVRLILAENNDKLIFTNPETDPFSNQSPTSLIDENIEITNNLIGSNNYDIGHVLCTGAGGIAYKKSVCTSKKAGGVSGSSNPTDNPFYIDYVAHEIGHQFGASHTQNNACNRNASTAYEPGSGSTIMGYAGICAPNLQNNSDDYFHAGSIEEILDYIENYTSCAEIISNTNHAPEITLMPDADLVIPANTPFSLTAEASDIDGDSLYYCWEQIDIGPSGDLNNPTENAPLFRSYPYTLSSERFFPTLNSQLKEDEVIGELLPDYTRDLNFRLSVRDLKGGFTYKDIHYQVNKSAGPFKINDEKIEANYLAGDKLMIQWDVAQTDQAPVNCSKVTILLSLDGGITFNEILLENTPNDGKEEITLPIVASNMARVKVKSVGNYFYDISGNDFNIEIPSLLINASTKKLSICSDAVASLDVEIQALIDLESAATISFNNLPDGINISPKTANIETGTNVNFEIDNTLSQIDSSFIIELNVNYKDEVYTETIEVNTALDLPDIPILVSPINGLKQKTTNTPIFTWNETSASTTNHLIVANDPSFKNIIFEQNEIETHTFQVPIEFDNDQTYYWKLTASNPCENSIQSETGVFVTESSKCLEVVASDIPKIIDSEKESEIISEIEITEIGIIQDVKVTRVRGKHSYIKDLEFYLVSPSGTQVTLMKQICDSEDNFDLAFADQSTTSIIDCPPTNQKSYKPLESLSAFKNELSNGKWQLKVKDIAAIDGGSLEEWSLEICITPITFNLLAEAISSNEVNLTWQVNLEDAASVTIEAEQENGVFSLIQTLDASSLNFIDNNVTGNYTYSYRLKIELNNGNIAYSPTVTVATPDAPPAKPENLIFSNVLSENLTLTWEDKANNENTYHVYRSHTQDEDFTKITELAANSKKYTDQNLEANSTYYYYVASIGNGGTTFSDTLEVTTLPYPPAAPQNLKINQVSKYEISLKWNDLANNEDGYIIDRKIIPNGNQVRLFEGAANLIDFTDTLDIKADTKYEYTIKTFNTGGYSEALSAQVTTLPNPPTPPQNFVASDISYNYIKLSWDAVKKANGYALFKANSSNTEFQFLDSLESNIKDYFDENILADNYYKYKLVAYNNAGNSEAFLETKSKEIPPITPPANVTLAYTAQKSVLIQWTSDNPEYQCVLQKSKGANNFISIDTLQANTFEYLDEDVYEGDSLFYRLFYISENLTSDYSKTLFLYIAKPKLKAPENLSVSSEPGQFVKINWEHPDVKNLAFIIERKATFNTTFGKVGITNYSNSYYIDSTITTGIAYYYRVAAFNKSDTSQFSDELFVSSTVTALNEAIFDNISVFPNPIESQLNIYNEINSNRQLDYSITSLSGLLIKKNTWTPSKDGNQVSIEFSNYPSGIYIIQLVYKDQVKTFKVLKK